MEYFEWNNNDFANRIKKVDFCDSLRLFISGIEIIIYAEYRYECRAEYK